MPISWNEIKQRALLFSKEWENETSEDAEAKSFWDGFFHIFDISRRRVATFEQVVKKLNDKQGFIDLLWKGTLMVEHKSKGRDLDRAFTQAKDYFPGLTDAELPKYILVSDFERFRLYNLDTNERHDFPLAELVKNVSLFGFIAGYPDRKIREQDPVNLKAAERMGQLHDQLKAIGYTGHHLELYLVRLLFCLFADDTTIFEQGILYDFIDRRTAPDGSDLARSMAELFQVLNTEETKRLSNLDEQLDDFPFVNGKLFEETLPIAHFNSAMRQTLLDCCALDWGKISPAIFGSLFQSVMDETARRNLGAHYTSEANILKLIKPLFLDALWAEFQSISGSKGKLTAFHKKLGSLRFLDPACGCGNFLIIAYREVRMLEIEVVKALLRGQQVVMQINDYMLVEVDHFYGIEYDEFPAQIAQVAMWLIDHQLNMEAGAAFGQYYRRLPLKKSAVIVHGNALRTDWQSLLQRDLKDLWKGEKDEAPLRYDFILGNPPFVGKSNQNAEQKEDMERMFTGVKGAGVLDYVTAWYLKAAQYTDVSADTRCAFVSTNSIAQGEQVSILWGVLFGKYHIKIQFAHRTFSWKNEARGNAAVHVVIVGFGKEDVAEKLLFEYEDIKGEGKGVAVRNINPYLLDAKDVLLGKRNSPICIVPAMMYGNKIVDGGFYLFTEDEKDNFLKEEPDAEKFFKPIISGDEYLNGKLRFILYLKDALPNELKHLPKILERINEVKKYRAASKKATTRELANYPTQFAEPRQPETNYLIIPRTSSENRKYIPFAFFEKEYIVNDSCTALPNATIYHFGVLTSRMHMNWVKNVCGRLESRYRYSNSIVYNNFPWPQTPSPKNTAAVEAAAQNVLDARAAFPTSSLADLYDPLTMPPTLVRAHAALDKAVDLCYRPQPFPNEARRMEFLFELYDKLTAGMWAKVKKGKR